ncbi:hypothetical protein [Sandarakinorhabdus sp. AAP62]|uniref:hypothetical protein n=1 Tax=Sandarakinorhabdus sp. AAP62 TaxID=1248916 RepID=UPI000301C4C9|nr:hypothetical protein [Sandarakinorhabdus sp. AAP62]
MLIWLPIMIYGTTVALGLALGWYFLSEKRPPRALQALHLILGFGGLEAVMLTTTKVGGSPDLKQNATIALVLLGITAVVGLFAGIMAKSHPANMGTILAAHGLAGGTAFLVLANWAMNAAG